MLPQWQKLKAAHHLGSGAVQPVCELNICLISILKAVTANVQADQFLFKHEAGKKQPHSGDDVSMQWLWYNILEYNAIFILSLGQLS